MRQERAAESPDLVFDAETSPAILWYRKAIALFEQLKKARQESAEHEAARKAAEAPAAEPEPVENKPQTPFRKNLPSDPLETHELPRPVPIHNSKAGKRAG
jgi:hypothetical protein